MEKIMKLYSASKCGHKNSSSDKFCSNCGTNLKSIENSIKDATTNIKDTITNNETYKIY
ncbi:zinc-ribbon domain-containing protein [Paraclostridium bifermentans]|nr:zinc-ribbon domain-containing protein [Paraclostridium bifermentans]